MARRGRKRKSGERYKSGDVKPNDREMMPPAVWRRIVDDAVAWARFDRRLASELNRLHGQGRLTSSQVAAGHRVASIYGRFEYLEGRNRSAKSAAYEMARAGRSQYDDPRYERRVRQEWATLQDYLTAYRAGRLRDPLELLCVEDRPIGPVLTVEVTALLDFLGGIFTGKRAAA